jgi:predicted S18 family serine protease
MAFHSSARRLSLALAAGSVALLAAGCVTVATPAPSSQLAVARAAITDAQSADAARYDAADLRNAQRKLDRAHDEVAQGDYATARALAEEAEVDARLAATRARSDKATKAAAEVEASIRALRDEIARSVQQ